MISSGTKRGLAAAAVSAMAVAGLPFLATSASAAAGDVIASATVNPIRNGGSTPGTIVLKTKNVAAAEISLADSSLADLDPTTPDQSITLGTKTLAAENSVGDSTPGDGYDEITVQVSGTTPAAGGALKFALYAETADATHVNADEARIQISTITTGAPASVDVVAGTPATAVGVPTPFSATIKDAAGNLTQLTTGESIALSGSPSITPSPATLTPALLAKGKANFVATAGAAGTQTVTATGVGTATLSDSASVTAYANADITKDEFSLNTGADTWEDGVTPFGTATDVRVDQNSVTFSFASKDGVDADTAPDDAGKVVVLALTSGDGINFNGTDSTTQPGGVVIVPILIGSDGKGSTTVALSGVTAGAQFSFLAPYETPGADSLNTATTVTMARADVDAVKTDSNVYVTKVGSATAVSVTVVDQFGNPIGAPAQVSITRGARNGSTTTARTTVDATGKATFSLPDAGTTAGTEVFTLNLYADQFDTGTTGYTGGTINYTVEGTGADFGAAAVTPSITPLNDGTATPGSDASVVNITAGTPGAAATVSVDNGALILGASNNLDKATATKAITLDAITGNGTFTVVGTKFGTATVTIVSGGRTKTVPVTIAPSAVPANVVATARNVAITGPDKATAGDTATFTATVTDAFGNPVPGVPVANLPLVVTGPANLQSSDSVTDAAGKLNYSVILTDNANSPVTARVTGVNTGGATPQFGASADSATGTTKTEPGLTASVQTAAATVSDVVNIAELQKAVDDAQAAVDVAQNNLENVQGDLSVAKTQQKVAKKAVTDAKKALKKAKKNHKGVDNAKKNLNDAKGDKQIADSQVKAANKKVTNAKATLAAAKQKLADAKAALEAAQSDS